MSEIAKILVPIYECRDFYPAYEHALWLAKNFGAALFIVGVVDKGQFIRLIPTPPSGLGAILEDKAVERFRSELKRKTDALADQAIRCGIDADNLLVDKPYPEAIIELTRQCDLMVESRLHRRTFVARKLFGERDIYTDACCPILVSKGRPFTMTQALLIYSHTKKANLSLRWLVRLAENTGRLNLRVLVLWRNEQEQARLINEVDALTKACNGYVRIDAVNAKDGFGRTVELVKKLQPSIVAMPTYIFSHLLRLRIHGIDMKSLNELQASVLLFT
jgi:nucleotide-binding universal stress UspA family protein